MSATYDVFFAGKEGFDEHIQITADDVESLLKERESVRAQLIAEGASTRSPAPKFNKPAQGVAKPDPMTAAAAQVFGTQVSVECPNGCGEMKYVNGGISSRTNKPYPSFYACRQCGAKQNAPKA